MGRGEDDEAARLHRCEVWLESSYHVLLLVNPDRFLNNT